MALAGKVRLFISDAIMDEMLEVLETKFKHSPKLLAREKEYIGKCTVRVVPKIKLDAVTSDPDDNRIVECAVHSRSEAKGQEFMRGPERRADEIYPAWYLRLAM